MLGRLIEGIGIPSVAAWSRSPFGNSGVNGGMLVNDLDNVSGAGELY